MARLTTHQDEMLWLWVLGGNILTGALGSYVAVFAISLYILLARLGAKDSINGRLLVITISLFLSSTAAIILNLLVIFLIVDVPTNGTDAEMLKALHLANILLAIETPFILLNSLIGDALLGFYSLLSEASDVAVSWIGLSFFGTSLVTVLSTTILITVRILRTNGEVQDLNIKGSRHRRYRRIAMLFIESGLAYALCVLLTFVLTFVREGVNIGIVPCLAAALFPTALIALVAMGKAVHPTTVYVRDLDTQQGISLPVLQFVTPMPEGDIESSMLDDAPYRLCIPKETAECRSKSTGIIMVDIGLVPAARDRDTLAHGQTKLI
ncbi:hypothetical protein GLOTRDRAFT_93540 [Gloeophyllum trabeum ATCC 11539]|uniref:Uncharacterized protein n=1 Tax=Gloeophyllum trabeum (strain ATCC 11539 / FP-39264 / Madison 617) TaxID=670483 RepID=S7Q968_GLOTA|nr:uncharacterized protein GLOTRDRAFT_93540 [Gloeophyllum trabeum ATCC 11539]EPQ56047.1 hypothetical protein GLOTRDRAFT_93540 [Gloeophyllum trabeum ATCC 11539]